MKSKEEEKKREKVRFILVPPMKLDYLQCEPESGKRIAEGMRVLFLVISDRTHTRTAFIKTQASLLTIGIYRRLEIPIPSLQISKCSGGLPPDPLQTGAPRRSFSKSPVELKYAPPSLILYQSMQKDFFFLLNFRWNRRSPSNMGHSGSRTFSLPYSFVPP